MPGHQFLLFSAVLAEIANLGIHKEDSDLHALDTPQTTSETGSVLGSTSQLATLAAQDIAGSQLPAGA